MSFAGEYPFAFEIDEGTPESLDILDPRQESDREGLPSLYSTIVSTFQVLLDETCEVLGQKDRLLDDLLLDIRLWGERIGASTEALSILEKSYRKESYAVQMHMKAVLSTLKDLSISITSDADKKLNEKGDKYAALKSAVQELLDLGDSVQTLVNVHTGQGPFARIKRALADREATKAQGIDAEVPEGVGVILANKAVERPTNLENFEQLGHSQSVIGHRLARKYLQTRRIRDAIAILERIVAAQDTFPEDHLSQLFSEQMLATAYLEDRRIKEAVKTLEHIVAVQRVLPKDDHPRLVSQRVLATAYLEDNRIGEAIQILQHVVAVQRKVLREDDHIRLTSEHELARAYLNHGRIKEAIEIFEHVIMVQRKILPGDNHSRLASEQVLATAYLENKQLQEAEKILVHVVTTWRKVLPEDDHSRLTSEHELARVFLGNGRTHQAIGILERIVKIQEHTLRVNDSSRVASEHELARAYEIAKSRNRSPSSQ